MFLGMCLLRKKCLLAELLDLDLREGMHSLSSVDGARRVKIRLILSI